MGHDYAAHHGHNALSVLASGSGDVIYEPGNLPEGLIDLPSASARSTGIPVGRCGVGSTVDCETRVVVGPSSTWRRLHRDRRSGDVYCRDNPRKTGSPKTRGLLTNAERSNLVLDLQQNAGGFFMTPNVRPSVGRPTRCPSCRSGLCRRTRRRSRRCRRIWAGTTSAPNCAQPAARCRPSVPCTPWEFRRYLISCLLRCWVCGHGFFKPKNALNLAESVARSLRTNAIDAIRFYRREE